MGEDVVEQAWAWTELRDARLGDARLTQRLILITHTLSKNPEESLPSAFATDRDAGKALYRFFDSDSVLPEEILAAHRAATLRRIEAAQSRFILLVQDTTHHATQGLGSTGAPGLTGFFLHSTLALEPDGGVPLGLLDWHWWVRDQEPNEPTQDRHKRSIEDSVTDGGTCPRFPDGIAPRRGAPGGRRTACGALAGERRAW